MKKKTKPTDHPLSAVKWVKPSELIHNDYNPNHVFKPEMLLLKMSLLLSGWTQPIVARPNGVIVDGFHRWTLGSTDKEIQAMTGGLVPVVYLPSDLDEGELKMATVRHNRARGKHSVVIMGDIVRSLLDDHGYTEDDLITKLGMEPEEVERLRNVQTSPEQAGADAFGKGWVPDK
jgi:ParB-like chromosome segregation protein Spo0J